jgi:hypothetical protein
MIFDNHKNVLHAGEVSIAHKRRPWEELGGIMHDIEMSVYNIYEKRIKRVYGMHDKCFYVVEESSL